MSYAKKPKYFYLTQSLKKLGTFGRFVRRGSKQSIARAAVNKSLFPQLVRALCRKELKVCALTNMTPFSG